MYETALSPLLLPAGPPKTRLLDQMAATPRYRSNGLPEDTRDVVIFADRHNAVEACEAVAAHCPQAVIAGVCVHKGETSSITARIHGETRSLPVLAPDCLRDFPHCLAVLYWSGCIVPDLLYHLETAVRSTLSIALFPRIPMGTGRKRDAALYTRHRDILERIYAELGDDESRLSFASVIKGLLTGEVDWLRPPVCPEYQHPATLPAPGDVVIDAGLFDSTVLRRFALAVGPQGHVYGFEPEPANFVSVQKTLAHYGDPGNVTLVQKGLYSSRGTMLISDAGPSGTLLATNDDVAASPCEVVNVDGFAEEYKLSRLDLLKMDIEGAELDALRGAAASLRRWRPKLHICAYHHIDDIVDIPLLIREIVPEYRFHFTAHVPYLNECVYYATAR